MQSYVKVKNGSYRNQAIRDQAFPLVKQYQLGANGGFITVDGTAKFGQAKVRIKVAHITDYDILSEEDFIKLDSIAVDQDAHLPNVHHEDDETVMARIADRFEILNEMSKAVIAGDIRAMIVTGPPGVGKSYGIERELDRCQLVNALGGQKSVEIVKGASSALGLYQTLYGGKNHGDIIVFDDCDTVLFDEVSLNLLKAVLDSGKSRKISWNFESRILEEAGIPRSFQFNGSVIFITNLKFDNVRSKKIADHLEALMSRCHYLDLTLDSMREKFLRVKQIARSGALWQDYAFSQQEENEILDYINEHKNKFREMSLRLALKIADLKKTFPGDRWKTLAKTTVMKHGAK